MKNKSSKLPFHYGWVVVVVAMLAVFACIGLGRLALGMLLPSMGTDLGLNCGWMVKRLGSRKVIAWGLVLVGASMMLISRTNHYPTVLALYVLTGIGSGAANMPLMGLVAHWFKARSRGRAGGLLVAGNGLAIMLSGTLIPILTASQGAAGWRDGWLLLGVVVMLIALLSALLLREQPESMGLSPIGAQVSADP